MSSATVTISAAAAASSTAAAEPVVVVSNADVVSIATWILLVTSSLAMLARLSTKWAVSRHLQIDDGLAIAALLCHIGSGVSVSVLDKSGLGANVISLNMAQRRTFAQSAFVSNVLFIAALCLAKLSIVLLFNHITRQRMHRLLSYGCAGVIAVWCSASIVGVSVLCEAPDTWDMFGRCYHPSAFWYSFGAINALTDAALIVIPAFIIVPLHMSRSKKLMILSCFGTRICDIGATVALLAFTRAYSDVNFTETLWSWVLTAQFIQCISIITSCIPYLKPLLESFPSGMFMSDEIRRKGTTSNGSSGGYIRTPEPAFALRPVDSLKSASSEVRNFSRQSDRRPTVTISGTRTMRGEDLDQHPLNRMRQSPSPDEMRIMKTTTIMTSN